LSDFLTSNALSFLVHAATTATVAFLANLAIASRSVSLHLLKDFSVDPSDATFNALEHHFQTFIPRQHSSEESTIIDTDYTANDVEQQAVLALRALRDLKAHRQWNVLAETLLERVVSGLLAAVQEEARSFLPNGGVTYAVEVPAAAPTATQQHANSTLPAGMVAGGGGAPTTTHGDGSSPEKTVSTMTEEEDAEPKSACILM